jgi:predicted HTH domain antitoxin
MGTLASRFSSSLRAAMIKEIGTELAFSLILESAVSVKKLVKYQIS